MTPAVGGPAVSPCTQFFGTSESVNRPKICADIFPLFLIARQFSKNRRVLAPFFADVDMRRLVDHQAKFISSVMGGPSSYSNAALRQAHAHLPIDDRAFDEMIGLFRATLEEAKITEADVEAIIADLNAHRTYIVQGCARM